MLGRLAEQASTNGEVWLTKRGRPVAVLMGPEEYDRLRAAATAGQRAELAATVAAARRRVAEAGLDPQVIDDAVAAARRAA